MRKLFVIFLGVLFLALPAMAGNWNSCTSASEEYTSPKILPGGSICYDPTSGDLDSVILPIGQCENFDVIFEPDMSGTGTAISCVIRSCVSSTVSTNTCGPIANATLAGVPPNTEIYGAAAQWIYVDCSGTIGSETPRILVHCAQGD